MVEIPSHSHKDMTVVRCDVASSSVDVVSLSVVVLSAE